MATHSSILAWRIPWAEEPGRLLSVGSQRVGHDLVVQIDRGQGNVTRGRLSVKQEQEAAKVKWENLRQGGPSK